MYNILSNNWKIRADPVGDTRESVKAEY